MDWSDRHGVSYLAWAWDAGGGWTCEGGPTLIENYDGTPTPSGRASDSTCSKWRAPADLSPNHPHRMM
jgi:hypothetical protein